MIQWIKKHIKVILSIIIIGLVAYFFTSEFKKNWQDILAVNLRLNFSLLVGSVFFMILAYLGNTATWRYLINSFHPEILPISMKESVAIVNTTQLAKYIPGKVWSYAVQIYWLSKRGYPKSNIFFINLVATLSTLLAASAVGIIMLSLTLDKVSKSGAMIIIAIVIIAYGIFILFHTPILNILIKMAAKLVKKEITSVKISLTCIFMTQFYYVISNLFFCLGGYLLCYAMGITDDFHLIVCMVGSLLVGDVVGFIVLITPGGLGVREGTMFLIISWMVANPKEVAVVQLVAPVAARLLTMSVDIALGITAFFLGQKTVFGSEFLLKSKPKI